VTRRAWAPLPDPLLIEPGLEDVDPVVEPVVPPVGDVEPGLAALEEPVLEDPIEEPADSSVPRTSTREFT
jgi:hypothetical protein